MKNSIWAWSILLVMGLTACYNDEGNYSYRDPESVLPLEISGFNDTSFLVLSEVEIVPEIKGMTNESDYWFTWYTFKLWASGEIPTVDTLATTKDLKFRVEYPAGNYYQLVFEIKEKKTGLFVNKKIEMRCVSEYTDGWFVLEDEDEQTNLDFVIRKDKATREDILDAVIGGRIPGKALKLGYLPSGYTHEQQNEDGSVTQLNNQRAMHILTTRDMKTLNMGELSLFKNFEDEFYSMPAAAAPQNIIVSGGDMYLLNAGCLHTISGMSANIGKFSLAKFGDRDLAPDMILNGSSVMCYSQETHSFVWNNGGDNLMEFSAEKESANSIGIPVTAMDMSLIRLLERRGMNNATQAYALMRGLSNPGKYYLADINFSNGNYPLVDFDEISPDRAVCHADVYGTHQINTIYFAKGNILSYYQKNASDQESIEKIDLYPFPSGETISYITQMTVPKDGEETVQEAVLMVLTNSSSGWKLYRFLLEGDGLSPDIADGIEPIVYKGKGNARYVMYMD